MAEVAVAAGAVDLDARHPVVVVGLFQHVAWRNRLKEAWPAGAGIEFRLRRKQRQPAAGAAIDALFLVIEQRPAERPLGAAAAEDAELVRRQASLPLGIA